MNRDQAGPIEAAFSLRMSNVQQCANFALWKYNFRQ